MSLDVLQLGPEVTVGGGAFEQPVIVCTRKVRIVSNPANTQNLIYQGRCLLVGALLRAGAADTILRIADEGAAQGTQVLTDQAPGVRTSTFNGYVGQTIIMDKGIVAQLDQIDAVGWILFAPF